jgi:hypothetical protein
VNKFTGKRRSIEMIIAAIITGGIVIISVIPIILDYRNNNIQNKREKEIEKIKYQKEIL